MSFSRAFSKRRAGRYDTPPSSPNHRTGSLRRASSVAKHQISGPVELISTTNMLSYNAPSLRTSISTSITNEQTTRHDDPPSPSSSAGTPPPLTPDIVDFSMDDNLITPPSTPPASSVDSSYFAPRTKTKSMSSTLSYDIPEDSITMVTTPTAIIPPPTKSVKRANSLTAVSQTATTSSEPIIPAKSSARGVGRSMSTASIRPSRKSSATNPFGPELAKVTELAEEMGLDIDEQYMIKNGLGKFSVEEYLAVVEDVMISTNLFGVHVASEWI